MLRYKSILFLFLILSALRIQVLDAQLYINEFSASNSSLILDPEFGDDADWVEIYNAGTSPVNLLNYYLSDNLSQPGKWQIKVEATIFPKDFILIWADGKDTLLHTSYGFSKLGEQIGLYTPLLEVVDTISFGSQNVNISYGRKPDGNTEWGYFTEPTPGSTNSASSFAGVVEAIPDFSVSGGIFHGDLSLELSSVLGGTIRYTRDGSKPDINSLEYTSPISINTNSVIRARVFNPDFIPGGVITHSYFMDDNFKIRNLPIISLATEPENFWDSETGIYVQDFKPDWEVPVNIELFENNGSDRAAFNLEAGTKVNGLYSWQLPQKMLGIYFRNQYGSGSLDYQLIFEKDRSRYENFALRASGSDWSYSLFRDILGQNAMEQGMDNDFMAYRPGIVFVNGQYMGIHNIREKVDEDYIVGNHSMLSGEFDLIENEDFAEHGDLIAFNKFLSLLSKDLSIQSNYDEVAAVMDIENFTDYVITEMATGNTSIDHNVMTWKPKSYGKWKWVLMDLDRGFFNPSSNLIDFYLRQGSLPFKELMQNDGYKSYFGQRLADRLITTFNPAQMNDLIDKHKKDIEVEIPYHIDRWLGTTSSYGNAIPSVDYWNSQVERLRTFVNQRPGFLINDLQNYGFNPGATLSVYLSPENAGSISLNGIQVSGEYINSQYPIGLDLSFVADNKPGYNFVGWKSAITKSIIPKGSSWKFLDDGTDQGKNWTASNFDDILWKEGVAELGYGDGDEATLLDYGGDVSNKHICYYFRKSFVLTASDMLAYRFILKVLHDDGIVVYVNGSEVLRSNMPSGSIDYLSTATSSVDGIAESEFSQYLLESDFFNEGENILAVEVHQRAANSSDVSFNLELLGQMGGSSEYLSANNILNFQMTEATNLIAAYEPSGVCIIPDTIRTDFVLNANCSPWYARGDVVVLAGAKLSIEPGVEVLMPEEASIFVHGSILAQGTESHPINFSLNPDYAGSNWGAICFINSSDTSSLAYINMEDASHGPELYNAVAAISAFNAKLTLDHIIIEKVAGNPVTARYSDLVITNSKFHSEITGDLVNMKYGTGRIENCFFEGNQMQDTDAIDYDGIENGVIRNCIIQNFFGINSDGIDIGEAAKNVIIENNFIYNITDKGISLGQKSTAFVQNNIFMNSNLGLGVKDSSHVMVNKCTFYNVGTPIACFEKNKGSAGGNAVVLNSILSNSGIATYSSDKRSTLRIAYSISDNDTLFEGNNNLYGDPLFTNPTYFDFNVKANSPCKGLGEYLGESTDIGAVLEAYNGDPPVMITGIYYFTASIFDQSEFITLFNPSYSPVDLSGYIIQDAIDYTFPDGEELGSLKTMYIAKSINSATFNFEPINIFQWAAGNLANEGEVIVLRDRNGIIIDKVEYNTQLPWPILHDTGSIIVLIDYNLDNHFGKNWSVKSTKELSVLKTKNNQFSLKIYPNPANEIVNVNIGNPSAEMVYLMDMSGSLLWSGKTTSEGEARIDVSSLQNGMYIIKAGYKTGRLIVQGVD
ncbi:MAG: CotH kinase family protein [Bacteroidales bacterium]|nr:CotH kinase family protein [Bacteroidales bacterium]MCF8389398.1 CotH kinase family protein [Bacteroidales bacterium]